MKVNQAYAMSEITQRQDTSNKNENDEFAALLEKSTTDTNTDTNVVKGVSDADVENFLNQLTSMGASAFWLNFNLEKIQEKIDKKREELAEQLGLNKTDENGESTLTPEKKKEALAQLEELLEDYVQELMKKMEARKELEDSQKSDSPLSNLLSGLFQSK